MTTHRGPRPPHDAAVVSFDEAAQMITVTCTCGHVITRSAESPAAPASREVVLAAWRRHCYAKRRR